MLKIHYNGVRFPRIVNLKAHRITSFLANRKELELEDYDAYLLLRNNIRLSPDVWAFNVVEVIKDKDKPWREALKPLEDKKETVKEPVKKEKPKRPKKKQAISK